jgi:hypothetical protein
MHHPHGHPTPYPWRGSLGVGSGAWLRECTLRIRAAMHRYLGQLRPTHGGVLYQDGGIVILAFGGGQ